MTESVDQFHARITSDTADVARIRKTFEAFLAVHGFDAKNTGEIGLVLNEALANVIRHAYEGMPDQPIEITASADSNGVSIEIRDWGKGIVPIIVDEHQKDPHKPGGLGLPCMKKMMTSLAFIAQPDGMLLKLHRLK